MADRPDFPTPRSPRYESLDLWRGVACLMIVAWHGQGFKFGPPAESRPVPASVLAAEIGWPGVVLNKAMNLTEVGVPLFFVISGYCIAASCDSGRRRSQTFKAFYARRFRRIFPPYWIYLGLLALLFAILALLGLPGSALNFPGVSMTAPWASNFWTVVGSVLLTSTWQDRLIGPGGGLSVQAWSLCYEEQFYAIAGILLWLCPRRLYVGVAVISAVVLALLLASPRLGLDLHGFFFDGLWLLFAAGFLAFYRINHCSARRAMVADGVMAVGMLVLALTRSWTSTKWINPNFFPIGIAFAMLLCWLHRWDLAIASATVARPFLFCGRMCYSLYLIHYPIAALVSQQLYRAGVRGFWPTMLVSIPTTVALSVAAAYVFSILVERRFLNPSTLAPPRPEAAVLPAV